MAKFPWCQEDGTPLPVRPHRGPISWPIESSDRSIWRYRQVIPTGDASPVSLGEGLTPLVSGPNGFSIKCEYVSPSGSFKDRGSSVLVSGLSVAGIGEVFLDSSGNAGASMAMYAAAAGIRCEVLTPASTPESKTRQAAAHGATITRIDGSREDVAKAARRLADTKIYASHNWQPLFIHGTKTLAYELLEQHPSGLPDHIVLPVGYGSLLLGLQLGFEELLGSGLIDTLPHLHAAQAAACAPLHAAFVSGRAEVDSVIAQPTVAKAIATSNPIRGAAMLDALRASGGSAVAVPEREILPARDQLARSGFYAEPSSAVAFAAASILQRDGVIGRDESAVVVLTGSGLKA